MKIAAVENPGSRVRLGGLVADIAQDRMTWFPEIGVGYYPVTAGDEPYNAAYFDKYVGYETTEQGHKLSRARCKLVSSHWSGDVVDIGIGSGAFIKERDTWTKGLSKTYGYDINPVAVQWLHSKQLLCNPYYQRVNAITLWDVLEHISDFRPLLAQVSRLIFVSIPIFDDMNHALTSKHFRRDEHFWYFTGKGLIAVMHDLGWECIACNMMEVPLGREDIGSFVFERRAS